MIETGLLALAAVTGTTLAIASDRHPAGNLLAGEAVWLLAIMFHAAAGGLAVVRWRLVGDTRCALAGVLWMHCAIAILPVLAVITLSAGEEGAGPLAPIAMLVLLVHASLVYRLAPVDTGLRPWWRLAIGLGITAGVGVALGWLPPFANETGDGVGSIVVAVVALVVAALVATSGLRAHRRLELFAGLTIATVAVAEMLTVLAPDPSPSRFRVVGTIELAAGLMALRAVAPDLRSAFGVLRRYEGAAAQQWRAAQETVQVQRERAHDVRSALQAIDGLVTPLSTGPGGTDVALASAVSAHVELAQSILAGNMADEPARPYELAELVERMVLIERSAGRPVSTRLAVDLVGYGHPATVAEILGNLLDNCARHAPGAAVVVATGLAPGGQIEMSVTDSGPGLPGAMFDKMFLSGWQRFPTGVGSGLGLASCDRLVSHEGGSMAATVAPGGGLRITVTLPVAPLPAPRHRSPVSADA